MFTELRSQQNLKGAAKQGKPTSGCHFRLGLWLTCIISGVLLLNYSTITLGRVVLPGGFVLDWVRLKDVLQPYVPTKATNDLQKDVACEDDMPSMHKVSEVSTFDNHREKVSEEASDDLQLQQELSDFTEMKKKLETERMLLDLRLQEMERVLGMKQKACRHKPLLTRGHGTYCHHIENL